MANKHELIEALQLIGRPIAYYPTISKAVGNNNAGVFLSQMLYWEGKQESKERWIRKPQKEITEETGLSRHETDSVRKRLTELKIMESRKFDVPAKLNFRFDWHRLGEIIEEYARTNESVKIKKKKKTVVIHQMKDAFDQEHQLHPVFKEHGAYVWTQKDFGQLENIRKAFEERILKKPHNLDEEGIRVKTVENWKVFLALMPDHYKDKLFYPSAIYSNLSAIMQNIAMGLKDNGDKDSKRTSFADQARKD